MTEPNFFPTSAPADPSQAPYLLVGLGNPGREYRDTRHNVGFQAIDALGQSFGFGLSRMQSRALTGQGQAEGRKVILAKPQTFMNLSGQAVAALARFYKTPLEQILILHDDLDLPIGTLRMRPGGGSAGQKGLISITERLGTQEFPRLRIGIGRPPGSMDPAAYVLQTFSRSDQLVIKNVLDRAVEAVRVYLREGLEPAMNRFNGTLERG